MRRVGEKRRALDAEVAGRAAKRRSTETYAHIGKALLRAEQAPVRAGALEAMIAEAEGEEAAGGVEVMDDRDVAADDDGDAPRTPSLGRHQLLQLLIHDEEELEAAEAECAAQRHLSLPEYELDALGASAYMLCVHVPAVRDPTRIRVGAWGNVQRGVATIAAPGYAVLRVKLPQDAAVECTTVDFDDAERCLEITWPARA